MTRLFKYFGKERSHYPHHLLNLAITNRLLWSRPARYHLKLQCLRVVKTGMNSCMETICVKNPSPSLNVSLTSFLNQSKMEVYNLINYLHNFGRLGVLSTQFAWGEDCLKWAMVLLPSNMLASSQLSCPLLLPTVFMKSASRALYKMPRVLAEIKICWRSLPYGRGIGS